MDRNTEGEDPRPQIPQPDRLILHDTNHLLLLYAPY